MTNLLYICWLSLTGLLSSVFFQVSLLAQTLQRVTVMNNRIVAGVCRGTSVCSCSQEILYCPNYSLWSCCSEERGKRTERLVQSCCKQLLASKPVCKLTAHQLMPWLPLCEAAYSESSEALDICLFVGPADPVEDGIDPDAPQCFFARGCCPFLFAVRMGLHEHVHFCSRQHQ